MRRVVVTTGARLHFGLLLADRSAVRQFGGIGVMVDEPGFQVSIAAADTTTISAPQPVIDRVHSFLEQWSRYSTQTRPLVRVAVLHHIPAHGGMGSGTQLGLAVGRALAILQKENYSVEQLARRMGRGHRSAIGIHGFERGGFIVDSGKTIEQPVGELAARYDWPEDWPIVLITLNQSAGLSGAAEIAAFRRLAPMTTPLVEQLGSIIESEMMPAIANRHQSDFCDALDRYGDLVGDYFGPAQGGRFADAGMRQLVAELRRHNCTGIAQSSWGPTVCVVCRNRQHTDEIVALINGSSFAGKARVVHGLNRGASVELSDSLAVQRD
jgi:beta-ribofuranosylaminobenzene 5'-phosphate synthase